MKTCDICGKNLGNIAVFTPRITACGDCYIEATEEAAAPAPLEPTYMVVDVSRDGENTGGARRTGRYCVGYGWERQDSVLGRTGRTLDEATDIIQRCPGAIVVPFVPDAQFVVVAWNTRDVKMVCVHCDTQMRNGWNEVGLEGTVKWVQIGDKNTRAYTQNYIFDLETAIKERDAILALNDKNLVDVHIACLDMMRGEGGAECKP